jgi:hypothetical protein
MRLARLLSKPHLAAALCALTPLLLAPMHACPAEPSASIAEANADIYGTWRLAKVLGSADISAMSDRQAASMVGKVVLIAKDRFEIGSRICWQPTYERSAEDLVKSFREHGHVSSANMGLPDPVTAIDARCTHLYLKAPGRIVVQWDGFYFEAVKAAH